MSNVDMCEHDWPGAGCKEWRAEALARKITAPSGTPEMPVKAYYHEAPNEYGGFNKSVGLEVRAYEDSVGALYTAKLLEIMEVDSVGCEPLCRLSDATAIIDGLRGENERIRLNISEYNEAISCYQSERDQQDHRIGELEGLLRHAQKQVPTGSGLHMRIDAALAAGKEVPPCPH